ANQEAGRRGGQDEEPVVIDIQDQVPWPARDEVGGQDAESSAESEALGGAEGPVAVPGEKRDVGGAAGDQEVGETIACQVGRDEMERRDAGLPGFGLDEGPACLRQEDTQGA